MSALNFMAVQRLALENVIPKTKLLAQLALCLYKLH